jgi:alginate O-acetyltransferase complex protein AlgI
MIFSSSLFLVYFLPVFMIIYFLLAPRFKNWFILIASILFYAWGAPLFVFFVAGSVLADFVLTAGFGKTTGLMRKGLFWTSVALNLGLLLYFKYMNFFVDQFIIIQGWFGLKPAEWIRIALPVGISFITFQKLSYVLEVYKNRHEPFRKLQDYALYIFMFPQLLSGPIVRVGQIAGQIAGREERENTDNRLLGFYRFIIGLAKKVLIADVLGATVNEIFALNSLQLSSGMAWIGAIGYTFQIYFDFSGYTDMAIGLARMMGFRLPENFNFPYLSTSITDFWKRWHITLSTWFRDYLFLPIAYATSRKLKKERYFGLRTDHILYMWAAAITFLFCGFWHGAAWTFILWGAYQGLFLIIDRLAFLKISKKIGRIPSILITLVVIVLGWVIFRSESLDYAHFYFRRMFSFVSMPNDVMITSKFWTMLAVAGLFSFWGGFKKAEKWVEKLYEAPGNAVMITMSLVAIIFLVLSLAAITSSGFSPFIYFRF